MARMRRTEVCSPAMTSRAGALRWALILLSSCRCIALLTLTVRKQSYPPAIFVRNPSTSRYPHPGHPWTKPIDASSSPKPSAPYDPTYDDSTTAPATSSSSAPRRVPGEGHSRTSSEMSFGRRPLGLIEADEVERIQAEEEILHPIDRTSAKHRGSGSTASCDCKHSSEGCSEFGDDVDGDFTASDSSIRSGGGRSGRGRGSMIDAEGPRLLSTTSATMHDRSRTTSPSPFREAFVLDQQRSSDAAGFSYATGYNPVHEETEEASRPQPRRGSTLKFVTRLEPEIWLQGNRVRWRIAAAGLILLVIVALAVGVAYAVLERRKKNLEDDVEIGN